MKKDLIFTFFTQFIILVSSILSFKLANIHFGKIGFSEFSLIKRNLAYIYTMVFFGMGITLPRFISIEIGKKSGKENEIFIMSVFFLSIIMLLVGIISIFFKKELSNVLFGNTSYSYFIFPMYFSLIGLIMHGLLYSYYRGKMFFQRANVLQLINIGVFPLIIISIVSNIEDFFIVNGIIISLISFFLLIKILNSFNIKNFKFDKFLMKTVLSYSIQRIPGDFALASLLTLPVIFVSHLNGVLIGGYVAFSISLLNISAQIIAPIGLIMLPKISRLLGENKFNQIKYYIKRLMLFSIIIAITGTTIYQIFAKEILNLYLKDIDFKLIEISKKIMWGVLFYPIYVGLRSIIDAYYKIAFNTISIFVSLIIFLLIFFIFKNIYFAFIFALFSLAIITLYLSILILRGKNE